MSSAWIIFIFIPIITVKPNFKFFCILGCFFFLNAEQDWRRRKGLRLTEVMIQEPYKGYFGGSQEDFFNSHFTGKETETLVD